MAEPISRKQVTNSGGSANFDSSSSDTFTEVTGPPSDDPGRPLAKLDQAGFAFNQLHYPLDLGNLDKASRYPYWIEFAVHIQTRSKYVDVAKKFTPSVQNQSTRQLNQENRNTLTRNFYVDDKGRQYGFGRKTTRTAATIRLYLPDTLNWDYAQSYNDASLSGSKLGKFIQGGAALGSTVLDGIKAFGSGEKLGNFLGQHESELLSGVLPFAENKLDEALGAGAGVAVSAFGLAVNPQVDVIYTSPNLREFTFDFVFAPRSADEAERSQQIVRMFKFHAAPEFFAEEAGLGRYFVPPSEFDLKFSIDSLGKISRCVLKNINVDYAPQGASFYSDGTPTFTRMVLQFRELEFITKEMIAEENY